MAKHLCHNITSNDQNNYSAPLPIIGLYVAGASLVCLLLLIYDVIHGIRHRKFWLPCKWFSLDSLTLTLLSIAAKLPVDLTTPMPGVWDQLSKLTGTAFICVCMGYLVPSLGANRASENTTNMAALSIFVITVIVNTCIQISTGVIFSFILEHILVMLLMLAMLNFVWACTYATNLDKELKSDRKKQVFIQGRGSVTMVQRLKLCYLHGDSSDPQFLLSQGLISIAPDIICLLCLAVVLQVLAPTLYGHDLRSCNGNETSDYGWSISINVATQILVILLASLISIFRMFMASTETVQGMDLIWGSETDSDGIIGHETFSYIEYDDNVGAFTVGRVVYQGALNFALTFFLLLYVIVFIFRKICPFERKYTEPEGMQEYIELKRTNDVAMKDWTLTKCAESIQRWMSKVKTEDNSLFRLPQLLSKTPPSSRSLKQLYSLYKFKDGNEVSCLYLVFLAGIASVSIPHSISGHLTPSLNEVFDVICFVEAKINPHSFSSRKKLRFAKAMWMGKDFSRVAPTFDELVVSNSQLAMSSELDHARFIIAQLKTQLPSLFIWNEVSFVMDFINGQECTTVQELFTSMEQLFVDMLHIFLMQLPQAICKEVTECPAEKYTKKVKLMLKFISLVEPLEDKVEWFFPVDSGITSLISTPASSIDYHDSARRGNEDGSNVDAVESNDDCNVANNAHEINEV